MFPASVEMLRVKEWTYCADMKQRCIEAIVFLVQLASCRKKFHCRDKILSNYVSMQEGASTLFHILTTCSTVCADHECGINEHSKKPGYMYVPGVSLGSFISHNRAWISARVFLASSSSSHKVITSSLTPTPSFNDGMPSPLPRPWGELVLSASMDWVKLSKLSSYSSGIE